jgi:hypothetical protein
MNGYGPTEATTFAAANFVNLHAPIPVELLPRGACGQL